MGRRSASNRRGKKPDDPSTRATATTTAAATTSRKPTGTRKVAKANTPLYVDYDGVDGVVSLEDHASEEQYNVAMRAYSGVCDQIKDLIAESSYEDEMSMYGKCAIPTNRDHIAALLAFLGVVRMEYDDERAKMWDVYEKAQRRLFEAKRRMLDAKVALIARVSTTTDPRVASQIAHEHKSSVVATVREYNEIKKETAKCILAVCKIDEIHEEESTSTVDFFCGPDACFSHYRIARMIDLFSIDESEAMLRYDPQVSVVRRLQMEPGSDTREHDLVFDLNRMGYIDVIILCIYTARLRIRTLEVHGKRVSYVGASELVVILSHRAADTLRSLTWRDGRVGMIGILSTSFAHLHRLEKLRIEDSEVDGAEMLTVIRNGFPPNIKELAINSGEIRLRDSDGLHSSFSKLNDLRRLELVDNLIDVDSVVALREGLFGVCMKLELIDLSHNPLIGDVGVITLRLIVEEHPSITDIRLCNVRMGDIGLDCITLAGLTNIHALRRLTLDGNEFTYEGIRNMCLNMSLYPEGRIDFVSIIGFTRDEKLVGMTNSLWATCMISSRLIAMTIDQYVSASWRSIVTVCDGVAAGLYQPSILRGECDPECARTQRWRSRLLQCAPR